MIRPDGKSPINYARSGSGEALVLINGWTAGGLVWPSAWVSRLEEQFLVIRPDNRGSGWSRTATRPFSIRDLADDVRAVLADSRVQSARVLGLSMGGMVAQELALRHPDVVDQLVLVGTRPPAPAGVPSESQLLIESIRRPARDEPLREYFYSLWARFAAPSFALEHPDLMDELVEQIMRRPTPRQGMLDQVRAMMSWFGARRLRDLNVPTTVIHGDRDPLIPEANGRKLSALIPGARYEKLVGVGHLVPQEAGDVLIAALTNDDAMHSARP